MLGILLSNIFYNNVNHKLLHRTSIYEMIFFLGVLFYAYLKALLGKLFWPRLTLVAWLNIWVETRLSTHFQNDSFGPNLEEMLIISFIIILCVKLPIEVFKIVVCLPHCLFQTIFGKICLWISFLDYLGHNVVMILFLLLWIDLVK